MNNFTSSKQQDITPMTEKIHLVRWTAPAPVTIKLGLDLLVIGCCATKAHRKSEAIVLSDEVEDCIDTCIEDSRKSLGGC